MEHFKIEHFERGNPGKSFPKFEPLDKSEVTRIRKELASKVNLEETIAPLTLIKHLLSLSEPVEGLDATSEGFDLLSTLKTLGLHPNRWVYINWDRFETIDRMDPMDLSTHFHDIRYPSADDIELFDDTLSWILLIDHSGAIRKVQFD